MDTVQSQILNPLRPYLLPLTSNLPKPLDTFLSQLLTPPCHAALLLNLSLTQHPHCVPLAISKLLGIAIITVSSIVKVPQILKLISSRSASGLSFTSYALETTSFLITLAYNIRSGFPFSTYGEVSLILIQDVVITALILIYTKQLPLLGSFLALLAASAYTLLFSPIVSHPQLTQLQTLSGLLNIASKVPQIATNYTQGGTGQLSAFAVFNYLAGSLSRIFTTVQEVDDKVILYGFVAGFVLNAVLAGQMVWYWNSSKTAGHGREAQAVGVGKGKGKVLGDGKQGVLQKDGAAANTTGYAGGSAKPASQRRRG